MNGARDQGFAEAFGVLYPRARTVAFRILGSVAEAEDAAAEALTRALVDWDRVGALAYRDAWVLRVTANVAIDVARRRRPDALDLPLAATPEDTAVQRVTLVSALGALPARQREAVALRHLAGLPEAEVAEAMRLSANSVKKHLQRGMASLRKAIPKEEHDALVWN